MWRVSKAPSCFQPFIDSVMANILQTGEHLLKGVPKSNPEVSIHGPNHPGSFGPARNTGSFTHKATSATCDRQNITSASSTSVFIVHAGSVWQSQSFRSNHSVINCLFYHARFIPLFSSHTCRVKITFKAVFVFLCSSLGCALVT